MRAGTLIVGGGQAGGQAAASMRQAGYTDPVTVLCAENWLPYQRPPLSKQLLQGEWDEQRCLLRQEAFYAERDIDVRLAARVTRLARAAQAVYLASGEELAYDNLVLATGARLRRLSCPGSELDGVRYLRDLDEALVLKKALVNAPTVAIIGAGYIGLEVAASARKLGCEVVVIELLESVMQRTALAPIARYAQDMHRAHGIDFHFGACVTAFAGVDAALSAVVLDNGREIAAQVAVVGIGVVPDTALAEDAGLAVADGAVAVDCRCRTGDPKVFAIGDLTVQSHPHYDQAIHVESVGNALAQARVLGQNLAGGDAVADEIPAFWSNQFDARLQMAGLAGADDDLLVRGDPASGRFSVLALRDDRVTGVQTVSNPKDFMQGRKLIESRRPVDPRAAGDAAVALADL